jgi:class II lanthipeptide synthase
VEAIVGGFKDAYELVCANRAALLRSGGPVAAFADVEVRAIARNTARYEQILHDSYHPDFLAKAVAREAFFDTLWSEVDGKPILAKLHRAERADLWNCDIPVFTTRPSSTDLCTSAGETIVNAFEDAPLREVVRRIEGAGPQDLSLQILLIRASLAEPQHGVTRWSLPNHGAAIDTRKDKADPLALATQIGGLLQERAIRTHEGASWIILEESKTGHAATAPAASDLYSGLPGISLFLSALATATGQEQFRTLANEALTELTQLMAIETNANLGGFTGLAGAVYALSACDPLGGGPGLRIAADRLAAPGLFDALAETDVISGLAGSVLALLAASRRTTNPIFLRSAIDAGKILHARMADRLAASRPITDEERAAVFGLGHGPIGAALAFARLGAHTRDRHFTDAAAALCQREIVRMDDWLRACENDGTDLAMSWCNGISGFLAALIEMVALVPGLRAAPPITRLLDLVLAQGDEPNDSLCHGGIGTALIVAKSAACGFVEPAVASALAERAISRIAISGVAGGTVAGLHAPGLMDGLSGIGLGLLALNAPGLTPDVLTLN